MPHLAAMTATLAAQSEELLSFSDVDTLAALDAIVRRRPAHLILERAYAASARGTALINRIKADPTLAGVGVRVVTAQELEASALPSAVAVVAEAASVAVVEPDQLDLHGTRSAARVAITDHPDIQIDGNRASLIDLSSLGAQVVSHTVLRPNQRVRVALTDPGGSIRVSGNVQWANFEMGADGAPAYRAGIQFTGHETKALEAFCLKYGR